MVTDGFGAKNAKKSVDVKPALAVDLGASGGKIFAASIENNTLQVAPIHSFSIGMTSLDDKLFWDISYIQNEIVVGIKKAARDFEIGSVGIDSWCNDYVLLDKNLKPLGDPRCYRDKRTDGLTRYADSLIAKEKVFAKTGQQFARFETCYQLIAENSAVPNIVNGAEKLVFLPDYLAHTIGAKLFTEYTVASVTNLYNLNTKKWDDEILSAYNINPNLFLEVTEPCKKVGTLKPEIAGQTADIFSVGSHDTACAVLAAPHVGDGFCFISSGTWSLVGAEIDEPIFDISALEAGFGNEGGVGGKIRFIKNVMGLWIVQECLKRWNECGANYSIETLCEGAQTISVPVLIDVDDIRLFEPSNMPETVALLIKEAGYTPNSDFEIVRIVFESLAAKYADNIAKLEHLTGKKYDTIHILGGGGKNELLNRLTAEYTGKTVLAGPFDATAIGNAVCQFVGRGESTIAQAREVIARSVSLKKY